MGVKVGSWAAVLQKYRGTILNQRKLSPPSQTMDPILDLQKLVAGPIPVRLATKNGISDAAEERGLVASTSIAEGQLVFSIAESYHLGENCCDPELADRLGVGDLDAEDVFLCKMIAILHSCASADAASARAAYFRTLPSDMTHTPMYLHEELLDAFGPSFPLAKLARNVQAQAARAHTALLKAFGERPAPSLAFVLWATSCLNSRCFELAEDEPDDSSAGGGGSGSGGGDSSESKAHNSSKPRRCLIPFADLLNHSATPTLVHKVMPDGSVAFMAARNIAEGEELTVMYRDGKGDACSFYLHYGFWPREGDDDGVR